LEDLDNMVNGSGGEGGAASRRDAQSIFDFVQRKRFFKVLSPHVALDVGFIALHFVKYQKETTCAFFLIALYTEKKSVL